MAFEQDGDLFILGGKNKTGGLSDLWAYIAEINGWIQETDAPHQLEKSCWALKGNSLVIYYGGKTRIFNFDLSTWSSAGSNTEYRSKVAIARIGNKTFYMGGNVVDEGGLGKTNAVNGDIYSNETLVLDNETFEITNGANLPVAFP